VDYATLCDNIQEICENTFTSDQLEMFTRQAEQRIYNTVQPPAIRELAAGTLTGGSPVLTFPTDLLYVFSFAVRDTGGTWRYLLDKDPNFIREAYPANEGGIPSHYAFLDQTSFVLGPIPDSGYTYELTYGRYPESIVTAGTTWLGEHFDVALLNGALVEAIRFMKGEADLVELYDRMYMQAIVLLKNLADGKMRQDTYRSGQYRQPVG
jgi:hypothetical protein